MGLVTVVTRLISVDGHTRYRFSSIVWSVKGRTIHQQSGWKTMTTVPRLEFDNEALDADLNDQIGSMNLIEKQVIPRLLGQSTWLNASNIKYRKITKNDNIKQTIHKLEKCDLKQEIQCIYSYGNHLQKMLSVIEIYKKVLEAKSIKCQQYNRITCFTSVQEGRNLLLEKKIRVPIMVVFIVDGEHSDSPKDLLEQGGFTRQPF